MPVPAHRSRLRAVALAAASAVGLEGCFSNEIADRSIDYNLASEQAHNREMLLNVVRASQRRPLEFTELQSISATGSAESQTELDVPLVQNGAEEALELAQHLNFSERPTFQVSVLDTQEFYQGILKPLSTQTLDFYLRRDLPRRMLFDLVLASVTVKATAPDAGRPAFTAEFDNDVTDDGRFDDFQALVESLIDAGLTTTTIRPSPTVLGPPLTADDVLKGDLAAKAAAAGFALKAVDWCDLDDGERADLAGRLSRDAAIVGQLRASCAGPGGQADPGLLRRAGLPRTLYRAEKAGGAPTVVLCLQPDDAALRARVEQGTTCDALGRRSARGDDGAGEGGLRVNLAGASPRVCAALNRRRASGEPLDCADDVSISFTFAPRSTYEILRYLGEVVRRETYPDAGVAPRVIAVKTDRPGRPAGLALSASGPAPICGASLAPGALTADGAECRPLFEVIRGKPPPGAFVAARYAGQDFYVAPTLGAAGREPTLATFQLLTELLALNRSAKDVPASTVFTIVAP